MMRKRGSRIHPGIRGVLIAAVLLGSGAALVGCVPAQVPQVRTTVTPSAPIPTPTSTTQAIPVYDPKGTADDNLGYFRIVGKALLDKHPNASGKSIVDWFVVHGFDKKAMEVTPDKTSIGLDAWNIEFSVKMNGTCLIGQAGNTGFQSFATVPVSTGKCLIGTTRNINW